MAVTPTWQNDVIDLVSDQSRNEEEDNDAIVDPLVMPTISNCCKVFEADEETNLHLHQVCHFEFPGEPIAWKRAKNFVNVKAGCKRAVLHAKSTANQNKKEMQKLIRQQLLERHHCNSNAFPIFEHDKAVVVEVEVCRRFPDGAFVGKKHNNGLHPGFSKQMEAHMTCTPDTDNLAKLVLDSFNKIVHEDDQQVAKLVTCKMMDVEPTNDG